MQFAGAYSDMEEEEEVVELSESDLLKLLDQQEPALQARLTVPFTLRSQTFSAKSVHVRCARDCSAKQPRRRSSFRL